MSVRANLNLEKWEKQSEQRVKWEKSEKKGSCRIAELAEDGPSPSVARLDCGNFLFLWYCPGNGSY